MARSTLLETRTVSYQELIASGRAYRVPPYQCAYSWDQEQWEDLWADIVGAGGEDGGRHYMGAVVVEARSDREHVVIDGQQRLATLSVLTLAVISALERLADDGIDPDANRARARELRSRFIGERDPASLAESSRLNLTETDNGFYQDYLVQLSVPANPRGLPRSHQLLWKCFEYFSDRIRDSGAMSSYGAALAGLISENVARRLVFILMTVDDALSAHTVFENLNARDLAARAVHLWRSDFS